MKDPNKNRAIVLAITQGGLTQREAAARFSVSTRWIHTLLTRWRKGGLEAVDPRSRAPKSHPNACPPETVATILELRKSLITQGLDAGPASIRNHLPGPNKPATATIWRILKRHNQITAQPQKRPRSSWKRFQASQPNEMWQSDFTHWRLKDGTDTEIISWLDDHSRMLLHISAHQRVTGPTVTTTFINTIEAFGLPTATLTDNAMVYTTRLARGKNGSHTQPNAFEQLLADLHIQQKNGKPNHPTTQGKIERLHQTLKRWLNAKQPAQTLEELNKQLTEFQTIYNTQRPHTAISRRTPHTAYHTTTKAQPTTTINYKTWRVRYDKVGPTGKVSLRHAGKLLHLGIGRAWAKQNVIILIHDNQTIIINPNKNEIIAHHTLNPKKGYQPKKTEQSTQTATQKPEPCTETSPEPCTETSTQKPEP